MDKYKSQLDQIIKAFKNGNLPGHNAMLEMAPLSRMKNLTAKGKPSTASVMLLLYQKGNELHFPLIQRTNNNPSDKHRGQIGLPGGKKEKADQSDWVCAKRETHEELGLNLNKIEFIGAMTPNYIPVSNYIVHPFVGYYPEIPIFQKQDEEVASIYELTISKLVDPSIKLSGRVSLASGIMIDNVPYFKLANEKVWGATAMMLNEFIELIRLNSLL